MGFIVWFALNLVFTICGYVLWDWSWWFTAIVFIIGDVPLFIQAVHKH